MLRKEPLRMCVGCRESKPKKELARVVKGPDGTASFDATGKMPGRGAYVCRDARCLAKAKKSRALERALAEPLSEDVFSRLEEEIAKLDAR